MREHPKNLVFRASCLIGPTATLALAACGGPTPGTGPGTGTRQDAFTNQAWADYDSPESNAVVLLQESGPSPQRTCTGTLITPSYVLTAKGCITGTIAEGFPASSGLVGPITVYIGPDQDHFHESRTVVAATPMMNRDVWDAGRRPSVHVGSEVLRRPLHPEVGPVQLAAVSTRRRRPARCLECRPRAATPSSG